MLKQRIFMFLPIFPDTEVFRNLPLSVTAVVFLYLLEYSVYSASGVTSGSGTSETGTGKR